MLVHQRVHPVKKSHQALEAPVRVAAAGYTSGAGRCRRVGDLEKRRGTYPLLI